MRLSQLAKPSSSSPWVSWAGCFQAGNELLPLDVPSQKYLQLALTGEMETRCCQTDWVPGGGWASVLSARFLLAEPGACSQCAKRNHDPLHMKVALRRCSFGEQLQLHSVKPHFRIRLVGLPNAFDAAIQSQPCQWKRPSPQRPPPRILLRASPAYGTHCPSAWQCHTYDYG
jgi:hypothetical protein